MNDMDDEKLFDGVGVVIDDHVFNGEEYGDKIIQVVDYLENKKHLPLVKYDKLPYDFDAKTWLNVKYLLLDWDLGEVNDDSGLPIMSDTLKERAISNNINFIKKNIESVVIPIFIFSNNSVDYIRNRLVAENVLKDDVAESLPIFIKSKDELFDENGECIMFDLVYKWVKTAPSIYVVQKWTEIYFAAVNSMALDLSQSSINWPSILWKSYVKDGVDPSEELSSLINQNILSRIQPVVFDSQILDLDMTCDSVVLAEILNKQRFINNVNLRETSSTGDLYAFDQNGYYLNIRPMCDCVGRNKKNEVYLIRGTILEPNDIIKKFNSQCGNFIEQSNTAIVGPVNSNFIEFRFKNIKIHDFKDIKDKRIGRIIPPFITHITQKYGLYVHRQGLPRIPSEIIPIVEEEKEGDKNAELLEKNEQLTIALEKLQKDNSDLQSRLKKQKAQKDSQKKSQKKSQKPYILYNCKVNIVPSLKKRRLK